MTVELQAISPDEYGPHSPAPKWKCFLAIMDCVEVSCGRETHRRGYAES